MLLSQKYEPHFYLVLNKSWWDLIKGNVSAAVMDVGVAKTSACYTKP